MASSQNGTGISYQSISRNRSVTGLPHNPYVGFFHRNYRLSSASRSLIYLPNSSPHVGTFRHAPGHSQRLKDLMWEDDTRVTPFISQLQLTKRNKYADRHIAKHALGDFPMSTFTSKSVVAEEDPPICMICLDAFADGDEIRNLKCSHVFHRACVDIWLLGTLSDDYVYTSVCPTCRQDAGSTSSSSNGGAVDGGSGSGIPAEIFVRIGQHLLEEGARGQGGTPSPLILSPLVSPPVSASPSPAAGVAGAGEAHDNGTFSSHPHPSPHLTEKSQQPSARGAGVRHMEKQQSRSTPSPVSSLSCVSTPCTIIDKDPPWSPPGGSGSCSINPSCRGREGGEGMELSFAIINGEDTLSVSMLDIVGDSAVEVDVDVGMDTHQEDGRCAS